MGDILQFPSSKVHEPEAIKLKEIADELDRVLLHHLKGGADPRDIAGIVAHRLGTLICRLENKSELWNLCEKILKKQAKI